MADAVPGPRGRCVVLVPVGTHVETECERGLIQLEARGYAVRRIFGYSQIDVARNQIASDALAEGFEELMWIDADIAFEPDAVDALRARDLPVVCAIYPKKGQRALASNLMPETTTVVFGRGGGLLEITHAATGFLLTRRSVYDDVRRACALPTCNEAFGRPVVPYFLPMIAETDRGPWYLGEDFAFSERVRRSGHRIFADTTIRLAHIGRYGYSWEDAGGEPTRYARYDFRIARSSG